MKNDQSTVTICKHLIAYSLPHHTIFIIKSQENGKSGFIGRENRGDRYGKSGLIDEEIIARFKSRYGTGRRRFGGAWRRFGGFYGYFFGFDIMTQEDDNRRRLYGQNRRYTNQKFRFFVERERLRQRRKGQSVGWPLSFLNLSFGKGDAFKSLETGFNEQKVMDIGEKIEVELADPRPLVFIEEPENGLYHKYLADPAVEMKKSVGKGYTKQLFVTTHSPFFVNALSPEEVWVLEKSADGFSSLRRASEYPHVKELSEEGLELGSLWYSDYFG